MSDPQSTILSQLVAKYIDGTISPQEAEELNEMLDSRPENEQQFAASLIADLLLFEVYEAKKSLERDVLRRTTFDDLALSFNKKAVQATQSDPKIQPSFPSNTVTGSPWPSLYSENFGVSVSHDEASSTIRIHSEDELKKKRNWRDYIPFRYYLNRSSKRSQSTKENEKTTVNGFRGNLPFIITLLCYIVLMLGVANEKRLTTAWNQANSESAELYTEAPKELPPIATVSEYIDVVWEDKATAYKRGERVPTSIFHIRSGLLQLVMNNGVSVILEGPAHFVINNEMNGFCKYGRISAQVPPEAVGYTISTPFGSVIDRGTEFFLDISEERSQVEVIRGKIDYAVSAQKMIPLTAGKAISIDLAQKVEQIPLPDFSGFMSLSFFKKKVDVKVHEQLTEKFRLDQKINQDPNLLLRFDLTAENGWTVKNQARSGLETCRSLDLSRCAMTDGPMANVNATLFSKSGSQGHARFELEHDLTSFTISAYVRVDEISKSGSTILCSGNYPDEQGAFCWQLLSNGESVLYVSRGRGISPQTYIGHFSQFILKRGAWNKLTLVCDSQKRKLYHLIDGRIVSQNEWLDQMPLRFNKVTIGNMTKPKRNINQSFGGAIADLQFYNAVRELPNKNRSPGL